MKPETYPYPTQEAKEHRAEIYAKIDAASKPIDARTAMYAEMDKNKAEIAGVTPTPPVNTDKTGGSRWSEGKPSVIYAPWGGMNEVGRIARQGCDEYAPYDYRVGQSYSTLLESTTRHLMKMLVEGPLSRDTKSSRLHAGHAAWNLLCLLELNEYGRSQEMDDLTPWIGITAIQRRELIKDLGSVEAALKHLQTTGVAG